MKNKNSLMVADKISFYRVGIYYFQEMILFGEIILCPGNGFEKFHPSLMNEKLGRFINLP